VIKKAALVRRFFGLPRTLPIGNGRGPNWL
jgi:hypothetical protein